VVSMLVFIVIITFFVIALILQRAQISVSSLIRQTNTADTFTVSNDTDISETHFEMTETPSDQNPAIVPEDSVVQPTEESTILNTTTWQEFKSRKIPIRFSYPSDWNIWEGTTPLSEMIQIADYISKPQDAYGDPIPGYKFEGTVLEEPVDKSLEKWIKQNDHDYFGKAGTIEKTLVDGFPTIIDYFALNDGSLGTVYIPLGDGTKRMIVVSLVGPETDIVVFTQLLNAFLSTMHITAK
ncbi:MAG TPA: hypothetical protein VJB65_04535, partial [Patescibacteria group bacterium]|nr:hypothetical protein [Patescibacteria group bacterium]